LGWNGQELQQVLSNPATPQSILEFAARHLAPKREDVLDALLQNPSLPEALHEHILSGLAAVANAAPEPASPPASAAGPAPADSATSAPQPSPAPAGGAAGEGAPDEDKEKKRETLLEKIGRMSAVEKIKLALTGNQESRLVLIRDSNKVVSRAVLQSPKVSDGEVEAYASMKNVSEEILRLIATNRGFMKNYNVARALLNNPRSPIDILLRLVNRMNERDLKGLSLNKNIAETIRSMAFKLIKQKAEANKPKLPGKH
jgi:hypothetical protein